jgi:hypothetical protein
MTAGFVSACHVEPGLLTVFIVGNVARFISASFIRTVHFLLYVHLIRISKEKFSLCVIRHYAMKMYGGVEVWIHALFS